LTSLAIEGAGAGDTTINDGGSGSDVTVSSGPSVSLSGLTISGGSATEGGGIADNGGNLTLTDDSISNDLGNGPDQGLAGGVYASTSATLTMTNDVVSNDSTNGIGGGVFAQGTATLTDDTFSGNSGYNGGGIAVESDTAVITDDTIVNNTAGVGGGIEAYSATVTATDDTIVGNTASFGAVHPGAGIFLDDNVNFSLADSLLADNTPHDCEDGYGPGITDGGYNVVDDGTCSLSGNSLVTTDSAIWGSLGTPPGLATNGSAGPETMAITSSSAAFEYVPSANCTVGTDELGDARPGFSGQSCDAGAYEVQPPVVGAPSLTAAVSVSAAPNPVYYQTPVTFGATVSGLTGDPTPSGYVDFLAGSSPVTGCQDLPLLFGSVSCATTAPPVGNDTITVDYLGDSNFEATSGSTSLTVNPVIPATLYVSPSGSDSGNCTSSPCQTLQYAVNQAEDDYPSPDTITIEVAAGFYDSSLTINSDLAALNIYGAGAASTTIDDSGSGSDVTIGSSATVTMNGFTITGGAANGCGSGVGGGVNNSGTVTLSDDVISGDSASYEGGGILNGGTATLTGDTLAGDSTTGSCVNGGGGIYSAGNLNVLSSTLENDSTLYASGGGILVAGGTANITNDTFTGDSAYNGGGIDGWSTTSLVDDTFWQNSAEGAGGGVLSSASMTIANSLLADDTGGNCWAGGLTDDGYNVSDDSTCGFGTTSINDSRTVGTLTLAASGSDGPETEVISPSSSAFEEVPASACTVSTDEWGDPRPGFPDQSCDAGAFEVQPSASPVTVTVTVAGSQTYGSPPSLAFTTSDPGDDPDGTGVANLASLSCSDVLQDGQDLPITASLPIGSYQIDPSSCTGLEAASADYVPVYAAWEYDTYTVSPEPVTVAVNGSLAYGSSSPSFTFTTSDSNGDPNGTGVANFSSLTCTGVLDPNGGSDLPINSSLPVGSYTIDTSTCTALSPSSADYVLSYSSTGSFTVSVSVCGGTGTPTSDTACSFTSQVQDDVFTVPAGVTSIDVVTDGGAGSAGSGTGSGGGGAGTQVTADVPVTPGSELYVEVGVGGGGGGSFEGGRGAGGAGGGMSGLYSCPGAGADASCTLVVAGGGGGGGNDYRGVAGGNGAGAGVGNLSCNGGATGSAGTASNFFGSNYPGGAGGGGGQCAVGGAGGQGGGSYSANGGAGTAGNGGGGGGEFFTSSGGGGGAGYYGGGGGGSSSEESPRPAGGGGGGGGSSFVESGASNVSMVTSSLNAPSLMISWGPPATPVTVGVSGSQTYGASTPSLSFTTSDANDDPVGTGITNFSSLTCSDVINPNGGGDLAIDSSLPVGSYTIDTSSCTVPTAWPSDYEPSYAGTGNTYTVTGVAVSVSVTGSQTYGSSNPAFVFTTSDVNNDPSGTGVANFTSLSCSEVVNPDGSGDLPINSLLRAGSYAIDTASCTALSASAPNFVLSYTSTGDVFTVGSAPPSDQGSPCGSTGTFVPPDTCSYTNPAADDTFTVPAGVTSVDVVADGASGSCCQYEPTLSGQGGLGAEVAAQIDVTPGASEFVEVDQGGGTGYDAGGDGGGLSGLYTCAGSGTDPDCAQVVAGGGGGGGYGWESGDLGGVGGNAGYGQSSCAGGEAGGSSGGGATGGGGGGCPGDGAPGSSVGGYSYYYPGSGGPGEGGNGPCAGDCGAGGAGGAGYYGGGGGGTENSGAGGGGGSSYIESTANDVSTEADSAFTPSVTISWSASGATAPGAPSDVYAYAGNGSATVGFGAATANGSAVSSYTVTPYLGTSAQPPTTFTCGSSAGEINCSNASISATVTGLTDGATYTFTVTANNAVGAGPASPTSNAVPIGQANPCGSLGTRTAAGTCTYTTVGEDSFTVPAGVTSLHVVAVGVAGSAGGTCCNGTASPGGPGSTVSGDIPVTPGTQYWVEAGVGGGEGVSAGDAGGGNGGGLAGIYTCSGEGTDADCATLVAAGGGGGGGDAQGANGGSGAGAATGGSVATCSSGGDGGSSTSGASGGGGGGCDAAGAGGGAEGGGGEAGIGGCGGGFNGPCSSYSGYYGGGGGGAGYYGGGGGDAGYPYGAGGGGGGSSYVDPSAGNITMTANTSSTASVTISWAVVPSAPTSVSATAGNGSATVSFSPPSSNGGATIGSYTVTAVDSTNAQSPTNGTTTTGSSSPITVTGLANGDSYTFTVTATNSAGTGSASSPSNSVTPVAPVASVSVTASPSPASYGASVSLSASVSGPNGDPTPTGNVNFLAGSNPISGCQDVALSSGAASCSTSAVPVGSDTISADYSGDGNYASASGSTSLSVDAVAPSAPTSVSASAGNTSATVSFSPPSSNGGATVTSYTVTAADSTNSTNGGESVSGSSSPITVTGLANGDSYTFTVTATNSAGTGAASSPSNAVTPSAPAPPAPVVGELSSGAVLSSGQSLDSLADDYSLTMQTDGNLVENDNASGASVWASGTSGNPGARAIMQGDGNLVVYSSSGSALWASGTYANPGAYLSLPVGGQLAVLSSAGSVLWAGPGVLAPNTTLAPGAVLYSPNSAYYLQMQPDGNLVEDSSSGKVVWASNTSASGASAVMQGDGNLVVYSPSGSPLYSTGTAGDNGAYLALSDSGQLSLLSSTGALLWAGPGELAPNTTLASGASLYTPNGAYYLTMQGDGNLVEYSSSGAVVWAAGISGNPGAYAIMQGDGNLVLYSSSGRPLWSSGTNGNQDGYLALSASGQLAVLSSAGATLWQGPGTLHEGASLAASASLSSPNGTYSLDMQSDGNLVEYDSSSGAAIWASGTSGNPGARVVMQGDGNLVLYSSSGSPLWATGTSGDQGAYLSLSSSGQLEVLSAAGAVLWAGPGELAPGESLSSGASLSSPNGAYSLDMQADGNLVEHSSSGTVVWAAGTSSPGAYAVMQGDGNLVVYSSSGSALFASGTSGDPGAYLSLSDSGQLAVVSVTGELLWVGTT
jgi:hypothetical protein